MSQPRILVVHPEPSSLSLLSSMLKSLGHVIDEAANDRVAVRQMERGGIDLVLACADPADPEALELLTFVRRKHRQVPVILLFPTPNPDRAKEALRLGALSVLRYPVPATELRAAVTQALGTVARPQAEPSVVHGPSPSGYPGHSETAPTNGVATAATTRAAGSVLVHVAAHEPAQHVSSVSRAEQLARDLGLVGTEACLRLAIETAAAIAPSRTPALIVGERGTGKTLLARAIHALGSRNDQPFVTVDCAALSEAMSGFERAAGGRAETGTNFDWASKLAQAQSGTLFLSEVAALSDGLQVLLLRALQEQEHAQSQSPHGNAHRGDVRFLMSTSENLVTLVEQARFRQDLYYRASVVCLKLPPLRHRGGDLEPLAEYFRARFSLEFGKNVLGFTRDALEALGKHDWPGNVRELEGVIQRGVALCQGTRITSGHLSPSLCQMRTSRTNGLGSRPHVPLNIRPLKEALEEPEKRIIIQALQALSWNRQETARVLDINRTTLYKKMKKYGLLVDEPIWVN
jgi:two-component system response regulator HydG